MELFTPQPPALCASALSSYHEFYDEERSIYRLNGTFDFAPPEIKWQRQYTNDNIILTAELSDSMLQAVDDLILTLKHDGSLGRAFWNGRLISDHAYGRFLPWEISCREFLNGSGTLQLISDKASYFDVEVAVRKKFALSFR